MNCNPNSGSPIRMPGIMPMSPQTSMPMQAPVSSPGQCSASMSRFPVGMGYVPRQSWETPYPMEQGIHRGTIFPSLDYPFMMGRCRR